MQKSSHKPKKKKKIRTADVLYNTTQRNEPPKTKKEKKINKGTKLPLLWQHRCGPLTRCFIAKL